MFYQIVIEYRFVDDESTPNLEDQPIICRHRIDDVSVTYLSPFVDISRANENLHSDDLSIIIETHTPIYK